MIRFLFVPLAIAFAFGCASKPPLPVTPPSPPQHDAETDRAALMQADRDFAAATASRGLEGWVDAFADDGTELAGGRDFVVGKEAIRALMKDLLTNPKKKLRWAPIRADVSGDLGYTIGHAEVVAFDEQGQSKVVAKLKYVTVWRRQPDGTWKVVIDAGNENE